MPLPSLQLTLVALIIFPTFLVFASYLLSNVRQLNSKWAANRERRKQRRAAHNVRLSFDSYGYCVKDSVDQYRQQELWERVLGYLHALGPFSFGNLDLMRHRSTLRSAMDDADKYCNDIHDALARKNPDAGLMRMLKEVDDLLFRMIQRQQVTDVVKIFLNFEKELKRVHDAKLPGVTRGVQHLEPTKLVKGVSVRRWGLLHWAVQIRDRFDIGSRRLILALIALILTIGLVRFLGKIPALVVCVVLVGEVLLDVLQAFEYASVEGFLKTVKMSLAGRISAPIVIAIMVANFALVSNPRPLSNAQLEAKGTFLETPPQYNLAQVNRQTFYVPAIFGIMHGTLLVLILIPLPLCYRLQTRLVQAAPRLRFLVPDNPVWLHRMLGFGMLGGLISGAMIWLVFQGLECVVFDNEFTCLAFDPPEGPGLDVFRLRFLIVWPFTFFFIPLMASPKYPDLGDESTKAKTESSSGGSGCPFSFLPCCKPKASESARSAAAAGPASSSDSEAPGVGRMAWSIFMWIWNFLKQRLTDICLLVVPLAGIALMNKLNSNFMFWLLILPIVLVHMFVKFRSLRFKLKGPCLCLDHSEEGPELFQRFWWEIAYTFHATAFSLVVAAALLIRFEIFFTALGTWGLYFLDRGLGLIGGCRNSVPIVVGSGQSSYVVTKGQGEAAQPSHVRLVVKRPEGFTYQAGQWAHVGFHRCGSFGCLPHRFPPALQWHAFSIASCEYDDFLEFHIQVHGHCNLLSNDSVVTAARQDEHYTKISRRNVWVEWLFPYYTPFFGKMSETGFFGSSFNVNTSGVTVTLTSTDQKETVRMLKPQAQWTGRLWNAISWLQDNHGKSAGSSEEVVHIMGPYGTLPWVFAENGAMMLIGAGVGFPSLGAMLRKCLEDNLKLQPNEQKPLCFIWTATKLEQLLLCFPGLLADLARYVHRSSLDNLRSWLTVKIFISSFDAGDYLTVNPSPQIFPEGGTMSRALSEVRRWLMGEGVAAAGGHDSDGTYIAQGSLGGSFADIFRNSLFMKDKVIERKSSLGVCFCGPQDLCSWIRTDVSNTILPVKVEFSSEVA